MRKKFWLQFHLWTIALLAVLTVANIASALRPFSSSSPFKEFTAPTVRLSKRYSESNRGPASFSKPDVDDAQTLKLARLPCDPRLRLKVSNHVKNLRLQFDTCPDDVTSIRNETNGFEGTVFGNAASLAMAEAASVAANDVSEIAGNFIEANQPSPPKRNGKKNPATSQTRAVANVSISTDYISLEPGVNEIRIQRPDRMQYLRIERR